MATTTGSLPTETLYSYDPMGRVLFVAQCAYIINCGTPTPGLWSSLNTYDLMGNLYTYSDGSGNVLTQTFDGAARPIQLSSSWIDSVHPANLITVASSLGYAPAGALQNATFGNNLTETFAYNNRLQPCRMGLNSSGGSYQATSSCPTNLPSGNLLDFTYGYNSGMNNGNVATLNAVGNQSFNRSYSYDSLNRLNALSSPSDPNLCTGLSWTYDAWGNRTSQTTTAGSCPQEPSTTFTSQNQFPSASGYTYDAAGNMTYDGSHHYLYDAENRLQYVDSVNTYLYNASGQRVAKGTPSGNTFYIYGSDGQVVSERDSYNNWIQTYLHFGGRLVAIYRGQGDNANTGFFFQDHLGSTRLITLMGQSVYDNMDYLPFGEQELLSGTDGDPHKFTSDERDSESNLDHTWFRQYSSNLGRWMHPDPAGLAAVNPSNPPSWNRYAYVRNTPAVLIDPFGACPAIAQNRDNSQADDPKTGGPSAASPEEAPADPQGQGGGPNSCAGTPPWYYTIGGGGSISIDGGEGFDPADGAGGLLGNSESTLLCPDTGCRLDPNGNFIGAVYDPTGYFTSSCTSPWANPTQNCTNPIWHLVAWQYEAVGSEFDSTYDPPIGLDIFHCPNGCGHIFTAANTTVNVATFFTATEAALVVAAPPAVEVYSAAKAYTLAFAASNPLIVQAMSDVVTGYQKWDYPGMGLPVGTFQWIGYWLNAID